MFIKVNDLKKRYDALGESDYILRVLKMRETVDKLSFIEGKMPENDKQIVLESKTASTKKLSSGDKLNVDGRNYTLSGTVAAVDYNNVLQTVSSGVSNLKAFGLGFNTALPQKMSRA